MCVKNPEQNHYVTEPFGHRAIGLQSYQVTEPSGYDDREAKYITEIV